MHAIDYKRDKFVDKEPFKGLFTQGMVCHETYKDKNNKWISPDEIDTKDGKKFFLLSDPNTKIIVGPSESMSKSKKNTIDPQKIIENYGADAVRLFILSDSPPEKDVQWSEQGIHASYKFIQKFFDLHTRVKKKIELNENFGDATSIYNFVNQQIDKITKNLEKFHYNVIIANFHETYNFLSKEIDKPLSSKDLAENYIKLLKLMSPVLPHFVSECLVELDCKNRSEWPKIDERFKIKEKFNIVVQINGKKRGVIIFETEIEENDLIKEVKKDVNIKKFMDNKKISKSIYIKNKLINLIIV